MGKKPKDRSYEVVTTRVGDLLVEDHSGMFVHPPVEERFTRKSHEATFYFEPGSKRMVCYSVGEAALTATIVGAHPNGNSVPYATVRWDTSILPRSFARVALETPPPLGAWEYVDLRDLTKVSFRLLDADLVGEIEITGDEGLQRVNAEDISVYAQHINDVNEGRPEIITIHELGIVSAQQLVLSILEKSVHPDLRSHIETIIAQEPEIFE